MASPEREHFNNVVLPLFIKEYVKPNDLVIDVGKPDDGWGYRQMFYKTDYKTLDINSKLRPDIIDNIEDLSNYMLEETVDCVVGMGIWEQCDNVNDVLVGIRNLLKPKGFALLGIMSLGYPMVQEIDYTRLTPIGVQHLINLYCNDCKIKYWEVFKRADLPSYIFTILQKYE